MLSSMTARARGAQLTPHNVDTAPTLSAKLDAEFKAEAAEAQGFPTESKFDSFAGRGAIPSKMYKPTHGGYPDAKRT